MNFNDISFSEILDIAIEILQVLEERKEKAESQATQLAKAIPNPALDPTAAVHLQ